MIRSMTGYSRAQGGGQSFALAVGIKSLNHRFLDLQFRLPNELASLEPELRRIVKRHVTRGHVEVNVNLERSGAVILKLDHNLLDAYVTAWRRVHSELGIGAEPDLVAMLRIPGMVTTNGEPATDELAVIRASLEDLLNAALRALDEMRAREGAALEQDFRERLERLGSLQQLVAALAKRIPEYTRLRLEHRLRELPGAVQVDRTRLAQEVALLVSRADISEELTRFQIHVEQARRLLDESSEVGKKLDFLLQELNREANTLLSKMADAPEIGVEVGRHAIEMKSEIEKLREQAQNIE
jgi:uncharacterized protein (TIGR00255 family)